MTSPRSYIVLAKNYFLFCSFENSKVGPAAESAGHLLLCCLGQPFAYQGHRPDQLFFAFRTPWCVLGGKSKQSKNAVQVFRAEPSQEVIYSQCSFPSHTVSPRGSPALWIHLCTEGSLAENTEYSGNSKTEQLVSGPQAKLLKSQR